MSNGCYFTKIYAFIKAASVTCLGHFLQCGYLCSTMVFVPVISCLLHYFTVSHLEPKSTWPQVRDGEEKSEHEISQGAGVEYFQRELVNNKTI